MLDAAQNQWGRLDCLLNNADLVKKRGDILDLQPDSFDENITINTRAPFFLAQSFSACWRSLNRNTNSRIARLFSSAPSTPSCWR
jgi:NAD(P)-dependent dehydrogenase (short-subunit alcohol dehydrogenase family)